MDVSTVAWYAAATAAALGFLWIVGLPFQLIMDHIAGTGGWALATGTLGLFPITVASWYALQGGHTLSVLALLLVVGALGATVVMAAIRVATHHPPFPRRPVADRLNQLTTAGSVFVLNQVMSFFTLGTVYAGSSRTVLSLGNNDIAAYAFHSQHMLEQGSRPGPIVGFDIVAAEKSLGYGADSVLAAVASILRTDTMHVLFVTTLAASFLGAYGLVRLLNGRLGVSRPYAILAAQAGYSVFFVAYLQGQYFLSQLLAMALIPAFLGVLFDVARSRSTRTWAAGVTGMTALAAAGIAIYPQLVLLAAAILLPATVFGGRLPELVRRLARAATAFLVAIALGAAVAPSLARIGWDISAQVSTVKAGWPLRRLFVTDLLGFQTSSTLRHSAAAWSLSAAIVAGLAVTIWWLGRRPAFSELAGFGSVAIIIILGSYLVVFWHEGVSYRQWKWITFLLPLFVALVAAAVLTALSSFDTKWVHGPAVARSAGGCYLLVVATLAAAASFPLAASPPAYTAVSPDAAAVARSPVVRAQSALNIDVKPYWDTMWLAYALRHKRLYMVSRSYFPRHTPEAQWTVERNDGPATTAQTIRLNATYRLVRRT